jgi:hypothetical protein
MGGLGILFVLGVYRLLALYALVKTPGWWRLATLAAVLLIPSTDSLWAHYVTMPRVCQEAGLKVYGRADKAGGLRLSTADDVWVTKYGFPFVEGERFPGRYYRISRQGDELVREEGVKPKARYLSEREVLSLTSQVGGAAYRIRDLSTGEVVGELITLGYGGGWAERFLAAFSDAGPGPIFPIGCGVGSIDLPRLYSAVFGLGEDK